MRSNHLLLVAATAAALLAGPAKAQPYLDIGVGRSDADVDCSGTQSCDSTGTAVRLTGGYALTPNWALELSASDLGKTSASALVPGVGRVDATARLRSYGLGVAGSYRVGDALALSGRLGVASNRTSVRGTALGTTANAADSNVAPYVGIGLHYSLNKTVALSLTVDQTNAEFDGDKASVVAAGLGLRLMF